MDHDSLIRELPYIEKLPNIERLRLAKERRALQLEKWRHREKEWERMERNGLSVRASLIRRLEFEPQVVLLDAAAYNDIHEVRRLLEKNVDPDLANEDGLTALHQSCINRNAEMVELLLNHGANVNATDTENWTPLHAAATCGHLELVKLLIEHNANLLAVNDEGSMPYDICEDDATLDYIETKMSEAGITQELIEQKRIEKEIQMLQDLKAARENGVNLDTACDEEGVTALHVAAAHGYQRVTEYLINECEVSLDPRDSDGWQPIHAAACWRNLEVLAILLQHGAELDVLTNGLETPLDLCDDVEVRERILQIKRDVDSNIRRGQRQKGRLRRSQSSNSHTHTIRRHSIRDKAVTPRKEAIEEAKLRQRLSQSISSPTPLVGGASKAVLNGQEEAVNGVDGGGDSQAPPPVSVHQSQRRELDSSGRNGHASETNGGLTYPPRRSSSGHDVVDLGTGTSQPVAKRKTKRAPSPPKKTVDASETGKPKTVKPEGVDNNPPGTSSLKSPAATPVFTPSSTINSPSTVSSPPGTLSSLKRQRQTARSNQTFPSSPPPSDSTSEEEGGAGGRFSLLPQPTGLSSEASPTQSRKRFSSAPYEVVGSDSNSSEAGNGGSWFRKCSLVCCSCFQSRRKSTHPSTRGHSKTSCSLM
ncbi:unnamed protein product [Cyprideis torosa]|uniref:Uncharacterized protein n=1 Tax=Cyprideis torosa TaxID=163714 RepID=A0A7R8W1T6_9CRUS|nr:unnamed protein product [Cyprideis torosa]CAG0881131.1 unnamed protein product [Cyprideis torosa]